MGCDGGTIPTRDELVRLKKKPEKKDKDSVMVSQWKYCTISQEKLEPPVVACELGRLYKKDKVIEMLLDRSSFAQNADVEHIKTLKDIKELKFTENPAYRERKNDKGDGYVDRAIAEYICPITGLEMSGKYRFCYIWGCGCVFSERAFKEINTEECAKCNKAYKNSDIVILNGIEDDVKKMEVNMKERRVQAKLEKKNKKKHKLEAAAGKADEATAPKQAKTADLSKHKAGPSTSKARDSKVVNGVKKDKSYKSIQDDPNASDTLKSLFTTSAKGKQQQSAHWVTMNPCFY